MALNKNKFFSVLEQQLKGIDIKAQHQEYGVVLTIGDNVAKVLGLDKVQVGELLEFENGAVGIALNLEIDTIGVILISGSASEEEKVFRTGKLLQAPVGEAMLGRVVNGIGQIIDGKGPLENTQYADVETQAPSILARQSVHEPLYTGITIIDSLIPIGKGQRELIIGDRKTGKTAIAIDAIINQAITHKNPGMDPVYCVYVAIGQKCSSVARLVNKLERIGAMKYTTVVAANASDPASMQFLAPYVACAIGEYFRDNGKHALIIYDDLNSHAVAYREISLLLRRPPGREAYPGDIFYLHSRLLERAGKLNQSHGGGSLTALPIIETQAGDVSAYIPTNVISITDGQIFLETDLFHKGVRPAINIGISVSRVGSAAQEKAIRKAAGRLKLDLAQYRELEAFTQFSSDVEQETKRILDKGKILTEALKQPQYMPLSLAEHVFVLQLAIMDYLQEVDLDKIQNIKYKLLSKFLREETDVADRINSSGEMNKEDEASIKSFIKSNINDYI